MTVLPAEITYGKVVGRFILAVADVPAGDPDVLPDATAAVGTVTLTPLVPNIKTTTPRPATVVKVPLTFDLDAAGYLVDRNGNDGAWVVTGDYTVAYALDGVRVDPHTITVLPEHDDATPLDLTTAIPPGGPVLSASEYAELSARISTIELTPGPAGADGKMPALPSVRAGEWVRPLGFTQPSYDYAPATGVGGTCTFLLSPGNYDRAMVSVGTASTDPSPRAVLALYSAATEALVGEFGEVDLSTTGDKTAIGTVTVLDPGYYYAMVVARTPVTGMKLKGFRHPSYGGPSSSDYLYSPSGGLDYSGIGTGALPASIAALSRTVGEGGTQAPMVIIKKG